VRQHELDPLAVKWVKKMCKGLGTKDLEKHFELQRQSEAFSKGMEEVPIHEAAQGIDAEAQTLETPEKS